jgi:RNA polymerase sigma factor (sigma-70 family)
LKGAWQDTEAGARMSLRAERDRESTGVSLDHFGELVAMHHGEIHRYLLLVTGRVADADDLSQKTFLRAFNARGSAGHAAGVRPWLFAIATDLSRSNARRRRVRRQIEEEGCPTNDLQEQHAMALALAGLPAQERIALALRKVYDFDYEQIGRMLCSSSQRARRCVMDALRRLGRMPSVRSALGSVEGRRIADHC